MLIFTVRIDDRESGMECNVSFRNVPNPKSREDSVTVYDVDRLLSSKQDNVSCAAVVLGVSTMTKIDVSATRWLAEGAGGRRCNSVSDTSTIETSAVRRVHPSR